MAVSRGTTPARHGSPMRATTPGRTAYPAAIREGMLSPAKNAVANESRPRLLGGMQEWPLPKAEKSKAKHTKASAAVPQTGRVTRSATNKLPGKPDRLAEGVISSALTKTTKKKRTPKKTATATPKVLKPKATKLTKNNKSSVKPKAGGAMTTKKGAAAAVGKKEAAAAAAAAGAAKGKRRPCLVEEPLPPPVGYHDRPAELSEACKRGVYRASQGWFDLTKMRYLYDEEAVKFEKETKTMRAHPPPPPPTQDLSKKKEPKVRATPKAKTGAGVKKSSPAKKVATTTPKKQPRSGTKATPTSSTKPTPKRGPAKKK